MKKVIAVLMSILLVIVSFSGCKKESETVADTVVFGTVYTAEEENDSLAKAFAIKDGKYIYVGDAEGAKDYIKKGSTKVINLGDGLVIPGATEGHGHFIGIDSLIKKAPCFNKQYEDIKKELKSEMNSNEKPEFFITWGLNYQAYGNEEDGWDKTVCYADELNEIAPDIPVICFDKSGHQALCNTFALKKARLIKENGEIHAVRGGSVLTTSGSSPKYSGWISDEIAPYVVKKTVDLNKLGTEFFEGAVKDAVAKLNERGFTNYLEAYINYFNDDAFYEAISNVDKDKKLSVNVSSFHTIRSFEANEYEKCIDKVKSMADKYKSEHFDPHNIKLFADGVVESMTGWMLEPYPATGNNGNQIWKQKEINEIVKKSNEKGLNVHTHTFGDAACRSVINAYINSNHKEMHNTLAHVRNITKEDIKKAADNNIGIAANLVWHASSDAYNAVLDKYAKYYPGDSFKKGYPMKSLIDAGVLVSSSTDAPCAEQLPGTIQNIIEVATTGINPGLSGAPYDPDELLTVREILECLTINGAKQLGIDDKCGSIKVGKNADFVIMDTNFLDYKGKQLRTIHNVKIENVYFEGKSVYTNSLKSTPSKEDKK